MQGISKQEMSSDQGGDQSAIREQRSQSAWELRAEKTDGRDRPSSCLTVKVIYV
jgi:hypothetical protein